MLRTLRTASLRAASLGTGPQWAICVILGAYVSIQLVTPGVIAG